MLISCKLNFLLKMLISLKYLSDSLLIGGMHINPTIFKFNCFEKVIKSLRKDGNDVSVGSCPEIYLEKSFRKILKKKIILPNAQYLSKISLAYSFSHLPSKKEIYQLARKSYLVVKEDGDGGPHDMIHTENFVLVDKQKRIRGYYDGTQAAAMDDILRDIAILIAEK